MKSKVVDREEDGSKRKDQIETGNNVYDQDHRK